MFALLSTPSGVLIHHIFWWDMLTLIYGWGSYCPKTMITNLSYDTFRSERKIKVICSDKYLKYLKQEFMTLCGEQKRVKGPLYLGNMLSEKPVHQMANFVLKLAFVHLRSVEFSLNSFAWNWILIVLFILDHLFFFLY